MRTNDRDFDDGCYLDGTVTGGLVAGIVLTWLKTRRFRNPNILVYRYAGDEPRSYWIPKTIIRVADALIWLIPDEVRPFLDIAGSTVEHDGSEQAVRLTTRYGTKLVPWRAL